MKPLTAEEERIIIKGENGSNVAYNYEDDQGAFRLRPGQLADLEQSSGEQQEGALYVAKVLLRALIFVRGLGSRLMGFTVQLLRIYVVGSADPILLSVPLIHVCCRFQVGKHRPAVLPTVKDAMKDMIGVDQDTFKKKRRERKEKAAAQEEVRAERAEQDAGQAQVGCRV